MIKPIWVTVPWMPWALAMVLWPFVLIRRGVKRTPALEAHELYHWNEIRQCFGFYPWYIAYGLLALLYRTGKRGHPLERPAYELADRVRAGDA